jgi:hypothetical protein
MNKILGLAVIALGAFLEFLWLGVCFGTIIIGILLLIFAPRILFFPFNFFLVIGLTIMYGKTYVNQRSERFQNRSYSRESGSFQTPFNSLDKYYETLESKSTDEFDVVKKNYRRLIKQFHYDSIASKNLPDEMVKFAEQKTQDLNEAYSAIKEARG